MHKISDRKCWPHFHRLFLNVIIPTLADDGRILRPVKITQTLMATFESGIFHR